MKKVIIIIVLCLSVSLSFSQGQVITLPPITTDLCDDGGFENKNIGNWGWSMVQYRKNVNLVYMNTQLGSGSIHNSSFNFWGSIANTRWEIVSNGLDAIFPSLPQTHTGNKALRLGRIEQAPGILVNNGAEAIQKTITINNSNSNLSFWYATVLEDPMGDVNHDNNRSPAFGVRVYTTPSNVNYIPILPSISGFATNPISPYSATNTVHPSWSSIVTPRGQWNGSNQETRIRPWTCAYVDLSQYIGQTITIEFIVNDCSQGGHLGYAYIDDICMGCSGSDMGDASIDGMSSDCGSNAIVNGTYTLPHNATTTGTLNSIIAELYQSGMPTGIFITIPSGNLNTTTQTFSFPMSLFGTVSPGNYDIVVKASFNLSGSTYTTISNLSGFIPSNNNDWQPICTQSEINCCQNSLSVVSPMAVPPSYPYNEGTYSVENFNVNVPNNVPITEIKVNVESFELLSEYKDCLKCDNRPVTLGSLFGIRNIGTGSNVLTLTNQPYGNGNNVFSNNNELIWKNVNGVQLTTTDKLSVIYILPSKNDIPCCNTKAKVCIRISWRDINCNYCETFTCSVIDLKNKSDLQSGFVLPNLTTLYLNSRGIFSTGHANGL